MKARVAVVGLGKMGLLHASILSVLDEADLIAVCEKSPLVRRFGRKILRGIDVVGDLEDLSGMGLDAVYVTTPASSHYPIIKAIYTGRIGRNVFVEKPLASSYVQSQELCGLANGQGGVSMVGYHRRFAVTFRKGKDILDEGVLGELVSFEGYAYSSDFLGVKSRSRTSARGGVLADSGCHIIDLALWYFGQLQVERANLESIVSVGSEDSADFTVRTEEGLGGELRCSWCMEDYRLPEMGLLVNGSKGTMKVNDDMVDLKLADGGSFVWHRHDLNDSVPFFLGGTEYFREDELFTQSILGGCSPEPSFQTASEVEAIVDQVKNGGVRQQAK